jgi:hypothetical protein
LISLTRTAFRPGRHRDLNCQSVKVARSLVPLDASGKSDLNAQVVVGKVTFID